MTQCCDWKVDLSAEKALLTAPPTEVGDAVVFTHTWRNAGPDRARDSVIKDKLSNPASIGVNNSTVVALSYAGGATGPATTTYGALVAGVTIPLMPAGSSVTGVFGGTAQEGFEGATLVNQTSIAPGVGHEDTNPLNNSAIEVVTLPLPCYLKCGDCYLKCEDELVRYSDPTGLSGFGVCFQPGEFDTFTWPGDTGGGAPEPNPQPGSSRVGFVVTNPFPSPCLVEATLFAFAECHIWGNAPPPLARFLFMHYVGPSADPAPPLFGAAGTPITSNYAVTNIDMADAGAFFTSGSPFPGEPAQEFARAETGVAQHVQILPPGASVQLYGLWKYAASIPAGGDYSLHGSYKIHVKITRMGGA